jgi:hypothetical protein
MGCEADEMPTVSERMHRMDARALRGKVITYLHAQVKRGYTLPLI